MIGQFVSFGSSKKLEFGVIWRSSSRNTRQDFTYHSKILVKRIFILCSDDLVKVVGGRPPRGNLLVLVENGDVCISSVEEVMHRGEAKGSTTNDQNGFRFGDTHCEAVSCVVDRDITVFDELNLKQLRSRSISIHPFLRSQITLVRLSASTVL